MEGHDDDMVDDGGQCSLGCLVDGDEEKIITQYQERGYLSSIRVLTGDEASDCVRNFIQYEQRFGQGNNEPDIKPLTGDDRFKVHLLLPWVWDLVHHPILVRYVQQCLQTKDVWCWSTDWNVKQASSKSYVTWHQDSTYAGIEPPNGALTAWLALTPSTETSGCVYCIPGSHHLRGQLAHAEALRREKANYLAEGGEYR